MSSLRDALQQIYDQHGILTPDLVVAEASAPGHPLYGRFTWDDTEAAKAWRREQAHQLIRSVRVVYREADGKTGEKSVRAFHAVRAERGYVYEPTEKVVADPFLTKLVLADMKREWQALKRRYEQFDEFLSMIRDDIDGVAS